MPFAPQTINIRYGDPSDLIGLAGQTGAAQGRMDDYRMQYQGYLQRLGLDQSFLENNLNREQADNHFRTQTMDRRREFDANREDRGAANELTSAFHQAQLEAQQKIADEKIAAVNARLEAQKAGLIGAKSGRTKAPVDLVNADGTPYIPPEPIGSSEMTDSNGNVSETYRGRSMTYKQGDNETRDFLRGQADSQEPAGPAAPAPMTRAQFMQEDRQRAARENLEFTQTNANTRQQIGIANRRPPTMPMTIAQRDAGHREADAIALQGVLDSGDPNQIVNTANADLWRQGAMMFRGDNPKQVAQATQMLQSHVARLRTEAAALQKPVTNSQGTTPTGGNVIKVSTPDEAMRLPPGTIYMAPDGVMRRIP